MIKGLKDAQITDGLPRVLAEQPWVRALSLAMLELHRKTMDYIDASQVYTAIDTVAEEVLDALAVNWKIDWYDTGYDIEQKRRIVKTALNIRRTMGTAGAARTQADAIYPGTKLEEWFEYGGTHGKFRLRVNITTVEERMLAVCFSLTSAVCASIAASLTRPAPAAARVIVSVFPAVHCASSSLPLLVITPFHATFRFLLT